jgi:hypothetical protein
VSWIDPRTAEMIASAQLDITGETGLELPPHEHDILCLLQRETCE